MLATFMGSQNVEKILFFLLINEKCYGTQLHRFLNTPLTPIQKGLERLEKAGVLKSVCEGKTRFYQFDPLYPLQKEVEILLRKAYELLPSQEKRKYYVIEEKSSLAAPLDLKTAQETLLRCWNRLKTVKMLLMNAKLHSEEKMRRGKGDVKVIEDDLSTVSFQEGGSWEMEGGKELAFSNMLRWKLDVASGTIALEHFRPGFLKPVFLVHLRPKQESLLESVDSHLCGTDTYFAKVQIAPHFLQLSWRIVGPRKNDRIECLYT